MPILCGLKKREDITNSQWYAVYVKSRQEKVIAKTFEKQSIEHFLPLYKTLNQWKDRKKIVERPLFAGYLFVNIPKDKYAIVLNTSGVVTILGNGKRDFVPIPQEEIDRIKQITRGDFEKIPCPFITEGQKIYIKSGPLRGFQGILDKKKNKHQIIFSIELLNRSVSVTVNAKDIKLL